MPMKFVFITSYIKKLLSHIYYLHAILTIVFFHETGLPINSMYSTTVVSFPPWLSEKKNCKGKFKKRNQISKGMNDKEHSRIGDCNGRCSGNDNENCNCYENCNDVYFIM